MPSDVELAHELIENGVSVIIGHHPHVVQGFEQYKNGLIFYSLGNFIYDPWSERIFVEKKLKERTESIIVSIGFLKDRIDNFEIIPTKITKDKTVRLMDKFEEEDFFRRFQKLNENINNPKIFYGAAAENLMEREIKTYWNLFKKNPFRAVLLFVRNFKVRYVKMGFYFLLKRVNSNGR